MRQIADWLKDRFIIDKQGNVRSKEPLFFTIKGEQKEIPTNALWFQTFSGKGNSDLIVSAIPTLLHSYCLQLAEEYSDIVKLNSAKRYYHRWPWESTNNTMHGYMTIINENGVVADGEVHASTVQKTMLPYICTIMEKRATDRLVLRALGLYSQGFYSKEEFGGDTIEPEDYTSTNQLRPEELEKIKLKKLINDVKNTFEEISKINSSFNAKIFTNTLLASSKDSSEITLQEWENVYKAASKELINLKETL